jgi:hypothetical protein
MFAAQGILAALYRRDALGGERGQIVDVSLMEACFALLESMVPEYDRLGIVRGPGGTGLKGVAPSNIFKSSDDNGSVIAANADKVFGRLCAAMGRPELAEDPRFVTHLARGENQSELEGIVSEWAGRHSAAEIDRVLNDAGVICGPIYTIADIFEDEQFRPATCCRAPGPGVRRLLGPGSSPSSPRPRARCAGRRPGRRAATTATSTAACSASPTTELAALKRAGRPLTVTSATSARATGSRTRRHLEPATRAELVDLLAAAGVPRIEAVSFVNPAACPQMAGAEEVVAGIDRREGVVYAGLVLNERGYDRLAATELDEVHVAFAATETFNRKNQNASPRSPSKARSASSSAPTRRDSGDGDDRRVVRLPVRGRGRSGLRPRSRCAARAGGRRRDRPRRHCRRRCAAPGPAARRRGGQAREAGRRAPAQHPEHRICQRLCRDRRGRDRLDASVGGVGGCPFAPRATGNICTEDLVYMLHGEGIYTGIDLDALISVAEWLEGRLGRQLPGQVYRAGAFAPVSG